MMCDTIKTTKMIKRNLFTLALALALTPLIEFVERFMFSDWNFLIRFLIPLMVLDTMLGMYKAIKKKCLSSKLFGMVLEKIAIYGIVLILANVLTDYEVAGEQNSIMYWFDDFVYAALMVKESISILENIGDIRPNLLPRRILELLKEYDLKGKITKKD